MSNPKQVVLVVDDTPENISLVSGLLKDFYKIKIATNGEKALAIARADPPDIILLDVMMPVMDGYETCRKLKEDELLRNIPVIFLTAKNDASDENMGFELGAVDYITKPISAPVMMARVKTHLALKQSSDFLQDKNHYLEEEISRRMKEINLIQEVSILAMASLAETRDNETGSHIQRTRLYVKELAYALSKYEKYHDVLNGRNIELIVSSAPLHDIGKVGIPDSVLLKPDMLTQDEFEILKLHTTLGLEAIERAEKVLNKSETFLKFAKEMAHFHHECWNGSGYPEGLSGEDIPISARLMAVADVYDALVSKRVYKNALSQDAAEKIIVQESGKHFDPEIVREFVILQPQFRAIAEKYKDI